MCKVEYCVIDGVLIIKKSEEGKGQYFMEPIGYNRENLGNIIEKLMEYKSSCSDMSSLFRDIEEDFLNTLKDMYGDSINYKEDEDNFDYIYSTKDLIDLSGKKYHAKKNHYHQFINSYSHTVSDLKNKNVAQDCLEFSEKWSTTKSKVTSEILYEVRGIADIVSHIDRLNMEGVAVYVDDKVVGFTIGEKVNDKMAIIHIEKGDPDYKGIYAFINKAFVEKYFSDTEYINREEDLGIKGLRKAKMSYHPVEFGKKYIVNI